MMSIPGLQNFKFFQNDKMNDTCTQLYQRGLNLKCKFFPHDEMNDVHYIASDESQTLHL